MRGGVCHNFTATVTTWRTWPVQCTPRVLLRWEGPVLYALSAMPKISRNFAAFLSGLIVVTPKFGGTSDTRAASLGEAHADVVLKVLKLATDAAYTDFLDRKLVEWYAAAPKSDRHAPA